MNDARYIGICWSADFLSRRSRRVVRDFFGPVSLKFSPDKIADCFRAALSRAGLSSRFRSPAS